METRSDLHVRLSEELRTRLDNEAERRGLSISRLIERACAKWLDEFSIGGDE